MGLWGPLGEQRIGMSKRRQDSKTKKTVCRRSGGKDAGVGGCRTHRRKSKIEVSDLVWWPLAGTTKRRKGGVDRVNGEQNQSHQTAARGRDWSPVFEVNNFSGKHTRSLQHSYLLTDKDSSHFVHTLYTVFVLSYKSRSPFQKIKKLERRKWEKES